MNWNALLGSISTLFFLVPVLIICIAGLYINKSLLALGIYNLINFVNGLMSENLWVVPRTVRSAFGTFTNYIDTPLMLAVLLFFCHTARKRRIVLALTLLFVAYEMIIGYQFGLERNATLYISGPGLLLIFLCSGYFFVTQLRQTIRFGKGLGRTLIVAGILFTYGSYGLIYFFYYIQQSPYVADVFLLYYFTSVIFCLLLTFGLLQLRRQHKKVQQLLLVREELRLFFSPEAPRVSRGLRPTDK